MRTTSSVIAAATGALSLVLLALPATPAGAQGTAPDTGARPADVPPQRPAFSIGQPQRHTFYGAGLASFTRRSSDAGATALLGMHYALLNPVTGLAGLSGEVYGTAGGPFDGGGARALATSRFFGLGTGVDWNLGTGRRGRLDWLLSFETAIRRGGVLGHGSMVRVDWIPKRRQSFAFGVRVPIGQPLAGRTRPRTVGIVLPAARVKPSPLAPAADSAMAMVARMATLLRAYTSLWSKDDERLLREASNDTLSASAFHHGGHGEDRSPMLASVSSVSSVLKSSAERLGYDEVMRLYDAALARAFAAAVGDSALGDTVARRARAGLFDDVIVPYDSLFGRVKVGPTNVDGFGAIARAHLTRWLRDSSRVAPGAQPAVLAVHDRWLGIVDGVRRDLLEQWEDTRMVWLPVRLALAPEDYDEQQEVDSLLGRMVGRPFTDRNALTYFRSADLPLEIARSIYAARDYHVLWLHDFTGRREISNTVDNIGYEMVADAYLPALTAAVKRYDQTGKIPLYTILLDQYFYEPRSGTIWMSLLENPLGYRLHLPPGYRDREAHIRERQAELRAAVAASARLQRDAARAGGADWIHGIVKVNVNITQPSDFSFRSHHIIPGIPFAPDNLMRDHRKVVIYDVTEADPWRGAMFLMGVGIGEHYASATWEDRGFRLRGPAALEARAALRRELRRNGFDVHDIPTSLRALESPKAVEQLADVGEFIGRALQVHNDVGFGPKHSSVARAMLYDLAQPGSVVVVPDPLWLSPQWGAMLAAAGARGARVQVIAPAAANAPSPQAPLLAMSHDVMLRVLQLRPALDDVFRRSGGELRVGIFAAQAQVDDGAGRRREVREGLRRAPWIRELIPFDSATLAVLDRAESRAATEGRDATDIAHDERARPPQLHQKTQLFARAGAISALVRQPGWDEALASAMVVQSQQTARFADQFGYEAPATDTAATRRLDAMLRGFEAAIPEAERKRVRFYFTVGTQNEDPRGIASDGEASIVTSGFQAANGLVDLFYLMARSTWIENRAELERYLPRQSWLTRLVAKVAGPTL